VGVETEGSYDADARRLTWNSVAPGDAVFAVLDVSVAEHAGPGRYDVPPTAASDSHFVEHHEDGTVVVRPATPTPSDAGGTEATATSTSVAGTAARGTAGGTAARGTAGGTAARGTASATTSPTTSPSPWPTERGYTGPPPTASTSPGFGAAASLAAVGALVAVVGRRVATESR